ncbi:hypothetical protein [Microbacterium sp. PF5]|uniref:hypothetical protein n=1 Tax=Microbacterium sp. PF5 TaxID=2305435 RepID=UPI00109BA076|nr:hypothetical protein [Microbacterium sp. PF5]
MSTLPLLGERDCPIEVSHAFALLEGDYEWSEERNERWLHLWDVLAGYPDLHARVHTLDTGAFTEFVRQWVGKSSTFDHRSAIIVPIMRHHPGELRHDLAKIGIAYKDLEDGTLTWNEIWAYVGGVIRDRSSTTVAAIQGHKYVPSPAEIAAWDIHEREMNAQRGKNAQYRRFPRPWAGKPPTYSTTPTEVTPERAARRAKLAAMF